MSLIAVYFPPVLQDGGTERRSCDHPGGGASLAARRCGRFRSAHGRWLALWQRVKKQGNLLPLVAVAGTDDGMCHEGVKFALPKRSRYQIGNGAKHYTKGNVMSQLPELIERALVVSGSQAELARTLKVPPSHVTMWKTGAKPCPPEDQARIGAIAGLDPVQTLVRAHIEKHEGTEKGDQLARVLGKFLVATGGAIASAGASAQATYSATSNGLFDFIRCIKRLNQFRHFHSFMLSKKAPI